MKLRPEEDESKDDGQNVKAPSFSVHVFNNTKLMQERLQGQANATAIRHASWAGSAVQFLDEGSNEPVCSSV